MKTTIGILTCATAIATLVLLTSEPVLAIDRFVDNSAGCGGNSPCYATIQAAVDDAGTGDTIRVANGTYTGIENRNVDFKGKAISVQSDGGPANCIIYVEGTFNRGFIFQNSEGAASRLSGFTITNANAFNGAGIYCDAASPTISNCHLIGNAANNDGGGIYLANGSSPGISSCLFSNNIAVGRGGGICSNASSPAISGCEFNTNSANALGGGVFCDDASSAVLTDCSFTGNTANFGGGIACRSSSPAVSNTQFNSNTADYYGGGVYCESAAPEISGCEITNNNAVRQGGGIYCCSGSNPNITGSIIDTNTANGTGGGGLCSVDSAPTINNSSISGNTAPSGSGGGISGDHSPFSISYCDINDNAVSDKGGGIYCLLSAATINICTVADNTAANGGGIGLESSAPTSDGSTIINLTLITGNTADNYGGGVYVTYSYAWITNSVISGNTAAFGGGIRCMNSLAPATNNQPAIMNCILNNNAADYGAGVDLYKSIATITNSTVYNNTAVEGGGIRNYSSSPVITNTILWSDSPSEIHVVSGSISVGFSDVMGGFAGIGNIDSDPLFVDPATNDLHLSAGSPCIDAATSTGAPVADLAGTARWDDPATPNSGAGAVDYYDIGAFEYHPVCTCDFEPAEGDGDVDGADLAAYIAEDTSVGLADFAEEFGRDDCS